MKTSAPKIALVAAGLSGALITPAAWSAAPLRTQAWCQANNLPCKNDPEGLPYAEPALCAGPNILACEDFNGGPAFFPQSMTGAGCPESCQQAWYNPAQTGIGRGMAQVYGTGNRQINPASSHYPKPQGAMPSKGSDYLWVMNWDPAKGSTNGDGSSWLHLRDVVNDALQKTYANGMPPTNEFHIRFQIYWTDTARGDNASWVWPGFPKPDPYNNSGECNGLKIMYHYTPGGTRSPASASTDGGIATDCTWWNGVLGSGGQRFGNGVHIATCGGPCNYEKFPMCSGQTCEGSQGPQHMEYGPFQSNNITSHPNDQLIPVGPNGGRVWRANIGQWYTIEYHAKWGQPNTRTSVGELWVDGVKIYSANDLYMCASSGMQFDNCGPGGDGISAIYLSAYVVADDTPYNGQQIIDNLVVAAGDTYIGVPGQSPAPSDTVAPTVSITAPSSGAVVSGNVSLTASASDNVAVAGVQFRVDGSNLGAEDPSTPFSTTVDTTLLTNGAHTLAAVARDAAGNMSIASIPVTVSNPVPPPPPPPPTPAPAGTLISALSFNEGSGTVAGDSSGSGNGAVLSGASWAAGRNGSALNLSGAGYASLPSGLEDNAADFSFSAWVFWRGGQSWERIFDFSDGTTLGSASGKYMFLTGKNSLTSTLRFSIATAGYGTAENLDGTSALPLNQWVHVAFVLEGGTGRLYRNGTLESSGLITIDPSALAAVNNRLGQSGFAGDPLFDGMLDDVRIYSRALSQAEVQADMNTPVGGTPTALAPAKPRRLRLQ